KLSFRGLMEVFPSVFNFAYNGDSFIFNRMYTETITKRIEMRKGILQPQSLNFAIDFTWSLSRLLRVIKISPRDKNNPRVAVVWIHEVKKPLRPGGACSATYVAAPPYSPPKANP